MNSDPRVVFHRDGTVSAYDIADLFTIGRAPTITVGRVRRSLSTNRWVFRAVDGRKSAVQTTRRALTDDALDAYRRLRQQPTAQVIALVPSVKKDGDPVGD